MHDRAGHSQTKQFVPLQLYCPSTANKCDCCCFCSHHCYHAGQMSASGAAKAPEIWDPTLMHKIALTGPGMATTGKLRTAMTSHTGVSQTTDGQITETGAPIIVTCICTSHVGLLPMRVVQKQAFSIGRWPRASIQQMDLYSTDGPQAHAELRAPSASVPMEETRNPPGGRWARGEGTVCSRSW